MKLFAIVLGMGLASLSSCAAGLNVVSKVFNVEVVKTNLERPWSLNFAPNGELLLTTRYSGKLMSLNVASGETKTFETNLPNFRPDGEGGMLGMELDPNFANNNKIYVCYSYWKDGLQDNTAKRNRVSSFVIAGNTVGTEKVLLDDMPGWWNHNGCRIILSPDKTKLFVSMGDAASDPTRAQDLKSLAGKVHRINLDGTVPTDNPYGTSIWTYGHRNIQGLAFQPGTGLLWSTEHGPNTQDELNIIKKGKNYGWPNCLGTSQESQGCVVENYQAAVKSYDPTVTVAPSDMLFYGGAAFREWKNSLLFVTLKTGRLYRLELNGESIAKEEILIDGQYGRLRDIAEGPDGFLYISTDEAAASKILRLRPK